MHKNRGDILADHIINFQNVTKQYNHTTVIDNLSFTLNKGEVLVLLGPSGCGKTTVLNMAAGITRPDNGHVEINCKQLGYVFQEPRLIPWKTALENVLFVCPKNQRKQFYEKAVDMLESVGLGNYLNYYPNQLSGGMKQRVSIARAFVFNPELIFMDEPFSALDISNKKEIQKDVISLLKHQNSSMLYVTHDIEEAIHIADKIFIFSKDYCGIKKVMTLTTRKLNRSDADLRKIKLEIQQIIMGETYNEEKVQV